MHGVQCSMATSRCPSCKSLQAGGTVSKASGLFPEPRYSVFQPHFIRLGRKKSPACRQRLEIRRQWDSNPRAPEGYLISSAFGSVFLGVIQCCFVLHGTPKKPANMDFLAEKRWNLKVFSKMRIWHIFRKFVSILLAEPELICQMEGAEGNFYLRLLRVLGVLE